MKLELPYILFSMLSIYSMFNSRLSYFVSGVFIGINYRDQLTPYTEPVQKIVKEKVMEVKEVYFPDLEIPTIPKPEPEPITVSRFQQAKDMISSTVSGKKSN